MTRATFLFLGTSASTGIPVLGCGCAVCLSSSPYNKRYRVSGLIKIKEDHFLIDAGPDFRLQALRAGLTQLTGLLLTHTHYDHIAGLDDLRPLCFRSTAPIPCLLSEESFEELKLRYHYLIEGEKALDPSIKLVPYTKLKFQHLPSDFGEVQFGGHEWRYVSYFQMETKVTGYLMGNFAYISDIHHYSEQLLEALQGVEVLVLGALREQPSQSHFSLDEAVAFARTVGAKKTYLTHIGHELDHETANRKLPLDIQLAYDGLSIDFEVRE